MSKLNPHAKLIVKLYKSEKTAKGTHQRLQQEGVDASLETVRQWLHQNANKLPTLRVGGGKPAKPREKQLFRFLPENADWVPDAYMYPEFFGLFSKICG